MNLFRNTILAGLMLLTHLAFVPDSVGNPRLKTAKLTCEYLENPLGIETSRPRLSWTMVQNATNLRNQQQTAYELIVSDNEQAINSLKGNYWESGKQNSAQSIHVEYAGKPLKSFTRYYWRVKVYDEQGNASDWSLPQWFETAVLKDGDWQGSWIGDGSKQFERDEDFYKEDPMPLFRKTFNIVKELQSARLYVSGLGYYEAYLNGKRVGDQVLDPGWTAYKKEILYSVYDISAMVKKGQNAAGLMVGNGWYNPLPLRFWGAVNFKQHLTTGRPIVNAMIRLNFTDGSTAVISTNEQWHTAPGPILRNNIYLGEHYDARLEKQDWAGLASKTSGWKPAVIAAPPAGKMVTQLQPPIRVTKILKPIQITEIKPGVFVADMGQNFAGVLRLRVKGEAGNRVVLRYGEDKYPNGEVNLMTAVAGQIKTGNGGPGAPEVAWQEDSYTLKGKGLETWSPRFTFHGFRYVEITGWPGKPTVADIDGLRLNSDLKTSGEFSSSNEMFNQLDKNIQWTFLSNVFSVQSDCPAREKLGYGGDLFCTTEAYMYHYNMANFYRKVVKDFVNDQQPLGGITETMPFVGIADQGPGDKSGPLGFQMGYPYLVKKIYDFYGDKRVIEENYQALTRHINFLQSTAKNNLFDTDLGDHESLDDKGIPFTASVCYLLHVQMMAEFAEILQLQQDELKYKRLAETVRLAIIKQFNDHGKFENGTQSTQLFALWSNLEIPEKRDRIFEVLISEFEQKNWHLSTGIFGTKMLFDVLRKADRNDMAYRIANQRDFPGWGYMIENGATTLWETWASSDNKFSKNHPMFGSVGEWFYRSLLGINATAPGFKKIMIKPQPAGDLKHAEGSYISSYGKIGSAWALTDQQFKLNVEIPVNTSAEVWLPLKYGAQITEGGKTISNVQGVILQRKENGYTIIQVGSGTYSFVVRK
jgi:alpha-L-rhamnosidase